MMKVIMVLIVVVIIVMMMVYVILELIVSVLGRRGSSTKSVHPLSI